MLCNTLIAKEEWRWAGKQQVGREKEKVFFDSMSSNKKIN
jgi:hypothetical protein